MRTRNLTLFILALLSFYRVFAQKNEFQVRYNYIGNHYDQLFGYNNSYYAFDDKEIYNKINTIPFRFHEDNKNPQDINCGYDDSYFRYYYLGLAYQRDSILKHYFLRFRVDKYHFNYKNSSLYGPPGFAVGYRSFNGENTYSSIQFTAGFGRTIKWKFISIDIGIELPFYFRGDEEYIGLTTWIDSTGFHSASTYYFTPGGFFTGISVLAGVQFTIQKHYGIGLEGSGGLIYLDHRVLWKNYGYYKTHFVLHSPALTFSYKF